MELKGIDVFSAEAVRVQVASAVTHVEALAEAENLPYLAPGFFDIQVNGYRGNDYNAADFGPRQIRDIVADLDAAGVTRHFPTLITGPRERTLRNLSIIAEAVEASEELRLAIPGIHLEGPYLSAEDGPRGAHDPAFIRDPDWEEFSSWREASRGMIRLVTLAPERPGALEFIRRASAGGVQVALGHTAADALTIEAAVRAGASL
jgi:N-acetylglucosamine-6-phosphate deacetylase